MHHAYIYLLIYSDSPASLNTLVKKKKKDYLVFLFSWKWTSDLKPTKHIVFFFLNNPFMSFLDKVNDLRKLYLNWTAQIYKYMWIGDFSQTPVSTNNNYNVQWNKFWLGLKTWGQLERSWCFCLGIWYRLQWPIRCKWM